MSARVRHSRTEGTAILLNHSSDTRYYLSAGIELEVESFEVELEESRRRGKGVTLTLLITSGECPTQSNERVFEN